MDELPDGGFRSRILAMDLLVEAGELRCRDPSSGRVIPDHVETVRMLEDAEDRLAAAECRLAEADRQREALERQQEEERRRVAELEEALRRARLGS